MSPPCPLILLPWRGGPGSTPSDTSSKWCDWKRKAHRATTARTAAVEAAGPLALFQIDPEPLQQRRRRVAVRHHAELLLLGPDVVAQVEIDVAFEVGDLVAERGELLLQRDARIARQRVVVGRPRRPERAAAGETVGEMADRDRIGVGIIIFLQHVVVRRDDEAGAFGAARKEQDAAAARRE